MLCFDQVGWFPWKHHEKMYLLIYTTFGAGLNLDAFQYILPVLSKRWDSRLCSQQCDNWLCRGRFQGWLCGSYFVWDRIQYLVPSLHAVSSKQWFLTQHDESVSFYSLWLLLPVICPSLVMMLTVAWLSWLLEADHLCNFLDPKLLTSGWGEIAGGGSHDIILCFGETGQLWNKTLIITVGSGKNW